MLSTLITSCNDVSPNLEMHIYLNIVKTYFRQKIMNMKGKCFESLNSFQR